MHKHTHACTYPSVWAHQCEFLQQLAKDGSVCFPEWMDGALSTQNTSLWIRKSLLKSFSFDESNRKVKSHKDFHSFTHCNATWRPCRWQLGQNFCFRWINADIFCGSVLVSPTNSKLIKKSNLFWRLQSKYVLLFIKYINQTWLTKTYVSCFFVYTSTSVRE